ncbi:cytidylyltransferase domain-containing protein [Actibacterium sp. 188UL27-1]|uniref:acylneuraminate cytidylyltransferase family protein n=1 Tax=Actibacterium sp. 188UL27-1 TaxID=2786961 RepID=UPI00195D09FE|nr:acylneuraminate cytidylyltransferase family protein [Actibacterium sp. 188UL27-1]MBM7070043.1 acylneuraminate cytidylyltransferase family protein [Actibacterium sp. 188UL27-1]
MTCVAVIPCRAGSVRVKDKNIRPLGGVPLLLHSINAAQHSGAFSDVCLVTDSEEYAEIGRQAGASCKALRPAETAQAQSPDILWLQWFLENGFHNGAEFVAIVRATSPFRSAATIALAMQTFQDLWPRYDSLRSISKADVHPGKMWTRQPDGIITPIAPFATDDGVPWHSNQTAKLPPVFYQNASLEITSVETVLQQNSISGSRIFGFLTPEGEEVDVNSELDFEFAEFLMRKAARVPN